MATRRDGGATRREGLATKSATLPIERAGFLKGAAEKKYKNIIMLGSGAFGNAATRLAAFIVKGGAYVYGSYPDIDELFQKQAIELDHKKREATLFKIQQLVYELFEHGPRIGIVRGQFLVVLVCVSLISARLIVTEHSTGRFEFVINLWNRH